MKATRRSRRILQYKINAGRAGLILLGIALACFGLKGFLLPNHFIDGGITGISLLTFQLTKSSGIPVSVWLVLFNIPFIVLGAKQIGKRFAIVTSVAIVVLAATIFFVEFPVITDDKLLTAIFGGFF
ncbi:MAG: YitT family protein, partial [Phormidesmis sp. FL-bin-119]|nr:YitT family protein [Pedobacter sp.]